MSAVCAAFAALADDPVVMRVGGADVHRSEFEYLYHKNKTADSKLSVDDYARLFALYKMKVAAARESGLDKTNSFREEMRRYRAEALEPYMAADSAGFQRLVDEGTARSAVEREMSHIMKRRTGDAVQDAGAVRQLDSIRKCVEAGASFAELARRYSDDQASASLGGHLGYQRVGRLPLRFEETAFGLKEGEVSGVVETPQGFHLISAGKTRPAEGKRKVWVIVNRTKEAADSAADDIRSGMSFDDAAAKWNGDETGALKARKGLLGKRFASEFPMAVDSMLHTLAEGEASAPFEDGGVWLLVRYTELDPLPSEQDRKAAINEAYRKSEDVAAILADMELKRLGSAHELRLCRSGEAAVREAALPENFSEWVLLARSPLAALYPLLKIDDRLMTVADFAPEVKAAGVHPARGPQYVEATLKRWELDQLRRAEEQRILAENPEIAMLLREYEEGSLLFEISMQKVWSQDPAEQKDLEKKWEAELQARFPVEYVKSELRKVR